MYQNFEGKTILVFILPRIVDKMLHFRGTANFPVEGSDDFFFRFHISQNGGNFLTRDGVRHFLGVLFSENFRSETQKMTPFLLSRSVFIWTLSLPELGFLNDISKNQLSTRGTGIRTQVSLHGRLTSPRWYPLGYRLCRFCFVRYILYRYFFHFSKVGHKISPPLMTSRCGPRCKHYHRFIHSFIHHHTHESRIYGVNRV